MQHYTWEKNTEKARIFTVHQLNENNGPVYKTNLVWTKSLLDHSPDQIWLCKRYLLVPNIWSGPKSGPKWDLLMCKDHSPIEFGAVPNLLIGPDKLVNWWKLDYYKNLEFIMVANIWRKNDKPRSFRALLFIEILTPLGKVSQNMAHSFLENLNLWCASFRRFVIQKSRKIKWNRENVMF